MNKAAFAFVGVSFLASLSGAQTLQIDHREVACAVAEKFPRIDARFAPPDAIAKARVVFQGENRAEWYSVTMKAEGGTFIGVLPKPKRSLKSFRYYVEVTGKTLATSRTPEFNVGIVAGSGECQGKLTAAALGSASVVVEGPTGAAALPSGFAASGVATATTAAAVGAAAVAGTGGGIGATALVLGGVAAAGGAVAVGAAKGGGGDDSPSNSPSPTPSGPSGSVYSLSFLPNPPGMDVSACAGRPLSWGGQALSVDANGNFNDTWAPNEPNTARITGQVTATSFQGTLACVNGARSGTLSATGSGGVYTGTFAFGPSTGQLRVTKN